MRPTILLFVAASAFAQERPAPAFEVASVKINQQYQPDNGETWPYKIDITPGSIAMRNVNIFQLIKFAWHVQKYQIVAPTGVEYRGRSEAMIDSTRYDVLAKCATPATEDEMRPMMQTLLAERFRLTLHRETRTLSVYALVEAKGGHKMRASPLNKAEEGKQDAERGTQVRGIALSELAAELADSRDFNVAMVDATGLQGRFDFEINFRKHIPQPKPGEPQPDVLSIIQETLQQDVGLKLEARKMPIEMLIIDRVEKTPVEN